MSDSMPPPPMAAEASPNQDSSEAKPSDKSERANEEFSMPAPPSSKPSRAQELVEGDDKEMRSVVIAAAAAVAAKVAPGQREKAIADATTAAIEEYKKKKKDTPSASISALSTPSPSTYEAPLWSGVPEGVPYTLEILKNGAIVDNSKVAEKSFYTFGRAVTADVVIEHPSSSRLHAVLQYNGDTKEAFIYDNKSTHGTFLNKKRIVPLVHVPLRVGDTIKLGESSRIYLFGGPSELMPEEGLNRAQRRQLQSLEYAKAMEAKEKKVAHAQMAKALRGGDGASWGMEDEYDEADPDLENVNWRSFLSSNKLTDKQQKQAEKIRSREYKITNLRKEVDRIQAKEKVEGGLTAGQASVVVRNEQAISRYEEEVEDIEEELNESIRAAITDRKKETDRGASKKKRKQLAESDEEYLQGSDDDDEFFDRTAGSGKPGAGVSKKKLKDAPVVESAATLYVKKESLTAERVKLVEAIAAEEAKNEEEAKEATVAKKEEESKATTASIKEEEAKATTSKNEEDAMATTAARNEEEAKGATAAKNEEEAKATKEDASSAASDTTAPVPAGSKSGVPESASAAMLVDSLDGSKSGAPESASAAMLADSLASSKSGAPESASAAMLADSLASSKSGAPESASEAMLVDSLASSKSGAPESASEAMLVDSLDAFMENMETKIENDKLQKLRKDLVNVDAQLERTDRLLKIADPDQYLKPGSKAVADARVSASLLQAKVVDKVKKAAAVAEVKKATEDISSFVEEFEEEEEEKGAAAAGATGSHTSGVGGGIASKPSNQPSFGLIKVQRPAGLPASQPGAVVKKQPTNAVAAAAAAQLIRDFSSSSGKQRPSKEHPKAASMDSKQRRAPSQDVSDAASAKVAADMAVLLAASKSRGTEDEGGADAAGSKPEQAAVEWVPPTDQKGDGRTALNDKLGY